MVLYWFGVVCLCFDFMFGFVIFVLWFGVLGWCLCFNVLFLVEFCLKCWLWIGVRWGFGFWLVCFWCEWWMCRFKVVVLGCLFCDFGGLFGWLDVSEFGCLSYCVVWVFVYWLVTVCGLVCLWFRLWVGCFEMIGLF